MCCDHQQPHTACLHRRQGLCEDMGHQSAWEQESHLPAGLPGEKLEPRASSVACRRQRKTGQIQLGLEGEGQGHWAHGQAQL